jgi:16S rRNA (guanine(966)-N(2))-methyltransferase RsmD
MRITGGVAKGIPIKAPKGLETRPTSDKVREAVFQTLEGLLEGRRALDLFAGSGALGLEALSRGADSCVFVEKSLATAKILLENVNKAGFREKADIIRTDFRNAARTLHKKGELFDLIFIDPPYEGGYLEEVASILVSHPIITPDAVLVVEHFKKTIPPPEIAGISLSRTRFYGQTGITYYFGA